ncbi:UNVERIFIED_CONTAM: hypothetical protein RMT77_013385 [Armadillidium vulgare]
MAEFPRIPWQDMTDEEINLQYSPSKWSKRFENSEMVCERHVEVCKRDSDNSLKAVPNTLNICYSKEERTKLDVFGEDLPYDSYILMYVHGGYWQLLSKELSSYVVEPLYKNGFVTVIVGYTLAPKAQLHEIVEEIRKATKYCCDLAQKRGSKGLILMGHSAGGHLVSQVLSTTKGKDITELNPIRGLIALSGIFDVRPVVRTENNDPLGLDEESAWKLSPLHHVEELAKNFPSLKALIVAGENDSPEFKRQSKQYCQALVGKGIDSLYEEEKEVDHFNLVENLCDENYHVTIEIIKFVKSF